MDFQTKRLLFCRLGGLTGTIEKYSAPEMKRLSDPFVVVPADGQNNPNYVDDPVMGFPVITLTVIVEKNRAFVANARALALQHKQNPSSAGPLTIFSHMDDGSVVDQVSLPKCTIQSVKLPDGDTGTHAETIAEIMIQPRGMI